MREKLFRRILLNCKSHIYLYIMCDVPTQAFTEGCDAVMWMSPVICDGGGGGGGAPGGGGTTTGGSGNGGGTSTGGGTGGTTNPPTTPTYWDVFSGQIPVDLFTGALPPGFDLQLFKDLTKIIKDLEFNVDQVKWLMDHTGFIPIILNASGPNPVGEEGSMIVPVLNLSMKLNLNASQYQYLIYDGQVFTQIQNFVLQNQPLSSYNSQLAVLHLRLIMNIPHYYQENNLSNFPFLGSEAWANTVHAPDEDLTAAERALVQAHPIAALQIRENVDIAIAKTTEHMGHSGLDDKSDAFRHAYFQAINTMDVGATLTQQFSDAHESEVLPQFNLEKQMDLFNNSVGISYGLNFPTSDNQMAVYIKEWALLNGQLRYLYPIDYSDPCFYGCPDNVNGTHGISASTQLIPTNQ